MSCTRTVVTYPANAVFLLRVSLSLQPLQEEESKNRFKKYPTSRACLCVCVRVREKEIACVYNRRVNFDRVRPLFFFDKRA